MEHLVSWLVSKLAKILFVHSSIPLQIIARYFCLSLYGSHFPDDLTLHPNRGFSHKFLGFLLLNSNASNYSGFLLRFLVEFSFLNREIRLTGRSGSCSVFGMFLILSKFQVG